ncbi:MAG: EamA family transporter [bacterium]
MKRKDLALALLVVTVWGANFTVIKLALAGVPSMLLVALRYTFTALPAIAFVKRPHIEWYYCLAYGLTVGVGQFGCLFYAMEIGMPAGLASVVLQSQAFLTLIFAAAFLKEALKRQQVAGFVAAAFGLYLIGVNTGTSGIISIPLGAFLLTLLAAAFFGLSNIVVRLAVNQAASKGERLDTFSLLVWSSLVPPLPLLGLALMLDTPQTLWQAISNINAQSVFAVVFLVGGATLFGFGKWNKLLSIYPTSKVAPLSLLVPVTGLITAQIVLSEQLTYLQWLGGLIILFGLTIANFGDLVVSKLHRESRKLTESR